LHDISFEIVLLGSDTLLPTFVELLKVFMETIVCSSFITFAATVLALVNHWPFRARLFTETGKNWAVTSQGNMADAPKPSHYAWQSTF
jgi:hypothetical protein